MAQYRGFPWRFVFTDLGSVTTTWADGLLTDRKLTFTLNQAATIEAAVWPDSPRVNEIFTDGYPLVAQSKRLIYGFRREAPAVGDPWVCRAAGILMSPEDEADPDIPLSHVQAWDPWMYMGARPCQHASGDLGVPDGLSFYAPTRGNEVVTRLLLNSILNNAAVDGIGNGTFIDAGDGSRIGEGAQYADWGGTPLYQGTIELTPEITFQVSAGTTVADAWTQLCDVGNLDIVLTPIYDPIFRPGYTHELSIYNLAGSNRQDTVFGWDMMGKNVRKIQRMHDGTPGAFFNLLQYFVGQGGNVPFPTGGPLENLASIGDFGFWWSQQFFPSQTLTFTPGNSVAALAQQSLVLAKQGKRTLTLDPIPDRSPTALLDYDLGDRVAVWSTNKLRALISTEFPNKAFRVQAIPVAVTDDGVETITSLILSPDYRTAVDAPGQGQLQVNMIGTSQRANVLRTQTMSRLSPP